MQTYNNKPIIEAYQKGRRSGEIKELFQEWLKRNNPSEYNRWEKLKQGT